MIYIEIFKLFGSIFVDSEKADQSIAKTEKKAESLSSKLGKGIKTAAKWGAGIVAAAGGAAAGLYATANKAAETTDRIDKMSQKLGLSRKAFQEWDFILSQNGVNIDSMKSGMKTLTDRFDELSQGGKVATEAFSQLGLRYENLKGLSREEIFEKTISALQGVEDEAKRAALANDLLGRSGQELAPLLNAGAGSVEQLKAKAQDLGLVLSDEAVDAGVKFTDTMDQLKRSFGAVFTQVGTAVMPIMQKLAEWIIANMPTIQGIVQTVFGVIGNVVNFVGNILSQYIMPTLNQLWAWIQPNLPALQEMFQVAFDSVGIVLNTFVDVIKFVIGWIQQWVADNQAKLEEIRSSFAWLFIALEYAISTFLEWAKQFWEDYGQQILGILETIMNTIVDVISIAIGIIGDIFHVFGAIFQGDWEQLWTAIQFLLEDVWAAIVRILEGAIDVILRLFGTDLATAKKVLSEIFNSVWDTITKIWNGIVGTIKGAINSILKAINGMIRGMNRIKFNIPDWVPGLGGKSFGFNLREIPLLAQGGEIIKSGAAIVGEKGPELLELDKGAKVKPLNRDEYKEQTVTNTYTFQPGAVTIPAKDIAEMQTVFDFFNRIQQEARAQGVMA